MHAIKFKFPGWLVWLWNKVTVEVTVEDNEPARGTAAYYERLAARQKLVEDAAQVIYARIAACKKYRDCVPVHDMVAEYKVRYGNSEQVKGHVASMIMEINNREYQIIMAL